MERVSVVCLAESLGLLDKPRNKRKYWVHPYNKERASSNRFRSFFEEVRKHEDKFFSYYRMSVKSFDELLEIVRPQITKMDTCWRNPLTPEERLSITRRYLATGSTYASLQLEYLVGKTTISKVVAETCQVTWDCLHCTEMPEPTVQQWIEIADNFYRKTNFPNCAGAVDGKHIRCIKPCRSGSKYFNYKKYFSVVLMAVADADLRFVAIDVGAYGQEGDSTVFRDTVLGKKLFSGTLNLPPPKCLPNTYFKPQPFVMVGDEAFRLQTNLLRPYPQRNLDARKRVFNYVAAEDTWNAHSGCSLINGVFCTPQYCCILTILTK
ncbi:uncharacterized protein LOC134541921 isoform X3 [Bacillus rossius redtenbacheri]|uniref:uncharacterized protein LOC134541921 isoform X3 n=1 Tax=Bacillus rossius redtenbacheri TaxID=93214 RepID=UPI002FDC9CA7